MLTVEYKLTEEEYLNYNYYTCWLMPEKKIYRLKYYLTISLLFFFIELGVLYILSDNKISTFTLLLVSGLSICIFFLLPFRMKSIFASKAKKLLAKSGPDTLISNTALTFTETGIFGKNAVAEVKYLWTAIKKKVIINDCYYLYVNIQQAVVIPIRAFQSKEENEKFELILAEHLPLETEFSFLSRK